MTIGTRGKNGKILEKLLWCTSLEIISDTPVNGEEKDTLSILPWLFESLHMKQRDRGTTSDVQKHRSLTSRYCNGAKKEENINRTKVTKDTDVIIEQGSIVEVQLDEKITKMKKFIILAVSDKFHGK